MIKSLSFLQLPHGINTIGSLAIERDDEEQKTYEMWMLETSLPFNDAVAILSAFVIDIFDGDENMTSSEFSGFRSWTASWTCGEQVFSAQLTTDADGSSDGYVRSVYGVQ